MRICRNSFQSRWLNDVHRYRNRQLGKAIAAGEPLAACLDRVSREALIGALRFWSLPTAGRKAQVIASLVERMQTPEVLREAIELDLSAEERDALAWVSAEGGIRSWNDFIVRFEDDFDESPYWQYHEPETIPGRLRMTGLLAVGTLDGEQVALIPRELRAPLAEVLSAK